MVRATLGSRSGPMTISATTAITISSENPMSNMKKLEARPHCQRAGAAAEVSQLRRTTHDARGARRLGLGLVLDLGVDGTAAELSLILRRGTALDRLVVGRAFHAV